jgi:hypothetical protein
LKPPAVINRTAAAISAAAIFEVFPGSDLFGGKETDTGFFYQFSYVHPLPPEARNLLEEKMRQIIREERMLREMEMVAYSAKELFLKEDHLAAVDHLETLAPKELVSLVQIGSFIDLAEGPFSSSLRAIGAFQITALKVLEGGQIRVEGVAFSTKEELKQFLRKLSQYSKANHLVRGQARKLWQWQGGHLLWLERGLRARKNLLSLLKKSFGGQELRSASEKVISAYCLKRIPFTVIDIQEKVQDPEGGRGLFGEGCQSVFQHTTYCSEKELKKFSSSLLQNIDKTLTILGFHASAQLVGRRRREKDLQRLVQILALGAFETRDMDAKAEWVVEDGLRRPQTIFELKVLEERGSLLLQLHIRVEKILALLLEHASVGLQQIENGENRD